MSQSQVMRIKLHSYDEGWDTFDATTVLETTQNRSALPAAVVAFILNEQVENPYDWVGREVEVSR